MSTILDALRRLQREQEAVGAERELRDTVTTEIPLPEERRANRAPLWLVGAGLLLLLVGAAGYWWVGRDSAMPASAPPDVIARVPAPVRPAPRPRSLPRAEPAPVPAPPASAPPAPAPTAAPPAATPTPMPPPPASAPPRVVDEIPPTTPSPPPPAAAPPPAPAAPPQAPPPAPAPSAQSPAPATPRPEEPPAPARPARINPVRVGAPQATPQSTPASDPKPAKDEVEKSAPAKPEPVRTAEPARAPDPAPAAAPPSSDLPELSVIRLRWHPQAGRRSVSLQLETRAIEDAREGDIVEGIEIEEILPDAIVVRAGDALHRIALRP